MADKKLLDVRKEKKRNMPKFVRQDAHKKKRIKRNWKRPRGLQSKMRLHKRGYNVCVEVGYRSPNAVRGLSRNGLIQVMVSSLQDLASVDAKTQGVLVSSRVGTKKRMEIVKAALDKNITVLNFKDASKYLADAQKTFDARVADKKQKAQQKKKEEKKKDEKTIEKVAQEESDKDKEKKNKDKVLTKKGSEVY